MSTSPPPDGTVVLLRHGTAAAGTDGRDRERPLADGVARRLAAGAPRLAPHAPDVALVSAARRTMETADAVLAVVPAGRREGRDDLYGADADAIERAVEAEIAGGAARILVVAHNPGISAAALALSGGVHADVMRPGTAVVCARRDGRWAHVETIDVQAADAPPDDVPPDDARPDDARPDDARTR